MSERRIGFDASVWMTPDWISPDRLSIGSKTAKTTARKLAAKKPASVTDVSVPWRSMNVIRASATMSRYAKNRAVKYTARNAAAHSDAGHDNPATARFDQRQVRDGQRVTHRLARSLILAHDLHEDLFQRLAPWLNAHGLRPAARRASGRSRG